MSAFIVVREDGDRSLHLEESFDVATRTSMVCELGDVRTFIDILTKAANEQERNVHAQEGITATKLEIKVSIIGMKVPVSLVSEAIDVRKVDIGEFDGGYLAESEDGVVDDHDVEIVESEMFALPSGYARIRSHMDAILSKKHVCPA